MSLESPVSMSSNEVVAHAIPSSRPAFRVRSARHTCRDQREYARRSVECDVWLIDGEAQYVLRCKTNDVSDAGLHVIAPIGFGLAVGQRFEARMAAPHTPGPMSTHIAASLGYATVIRTEIKVDNSKSDRVGCALRFDVPQLIPS